MPTRRATGWAVQRCAEISELGAATELSQIQPSDEKGTPAIDINRLAWLEVWGRCRCWTTNHFACRALAYSLSNHWVIIHLVVMQNRNRFSNHFNSTSPASERRTEATESLQSFVVKEIITACGYQARCTVDTTADCAAKFTQDYGATTVCTVHKS